MHKMEELKELLLRELSEVTESGEISKSNLDVIDKLTHAIKSIETILAMNGYSDRGRKRDSMGRYSSRNYSYDDGGGYSREELADGLRDLHSHARSEESKRMIDDWMRQLKG